MNNGNPAAKGPRKYNVQSTPEGGLDAAVASLPHRPVALPPEAALRRRSTNAVNRLLSSTVDWLASLPPNVRPLSLATKFPRVANRIAQEWGEPGTCRKDFDDLVYDNRGNRRGFPPDVLVELLALRDYYYGYDLRLAREA